MDECEIVTSDKNRMSWHAILVQVYRGKSLARTFMNLTIARMVNAKGIALDIGGGRSPSYLGFLDNTALDRLVVIDINPHGERIDILGSVAMLPLRSGSCDAVL